MVKLVPGNEKPYVLDSSFCGLAHYAPEGCRPDEPPCARSEGHSSGGEYVTEPPSSGGKCQEIMAAGPEILSFIL